jgi:hypothetical protein
LWANYSFSFFMYHKLIFTLLHLLLNLDFLGLSSWLDIVDAFSRVVVHFYANLLDVLLSFLKFYTFLFKFSLAFSFHDQTPPVSLCRFTIILLLLMMFQQFVLPCNFNHLLRFDFTLSSYLVSLIDFSHLKLLQFPGSSLFLVLKLPSSSPQHISLFLFSLGNLDFFNRSLFLSI